MKPTDPKAPRSLWVLIPPPPLFVLPFVAGVQLSHLAPAPLVPMTLLPLSRALGVALVGIALLCMGSAIALFIRRRTTIIPHASACSLVITGSFRFTRNPMYLGLTVAYLGAALAMNVAWPLAFLPLPLWVMQSKVIPFEERNMLRVFGQDYIAYQQRVGRWLTLRA